MRWWRRQAEPRSDRGTRGPRLRNRRRAAGEGAVELGLIALRLPCRGRVRGVDQPEKPVDRDRLLPPELLEPVLADIDHAEVILGDVERVAKPRRFEGLAESTAERNGAVADRLNDDDVTIGKPSGVGGQQVDLLLIGDGLAAGGEEKQDAVAP